MSSWMHEPCITMEINPCPACGHMPEEVKAFMRLNYRLACRCGVAGPWSPFSDRADLIRNWEVVAGAKPTPIHTSRKPQIKD